MQNEVLVKRSNLKQTIKCEHCSNPHFKVSRGLLTTELTCTNCGKSFHIPSDSYCCK